jgi:hypothetical protein
MKCLAGVIRRSVLFRKYILTGGELVRIGKATNVEKGVMRTYWVSS